MLTYVALALTATWLGSPLLRIRNMVSSVVDAVESEIASTKLTEISTGSHLFKFIGYSNKGIGVGKCVTSEIFTLGGYEWTITYYPDGNSAENKNLLAFYVTLRSDDTEARVKISLTMLSQTGGTSVMGYSSDALTLSTNESWGFLIKKEEFEASEHLKDDSFTIRCTVIVIKNSRFTVLPSNLHQQLTDLLERGDGTDVSFNVSGVTLDAHRCVLAARSPVFMAQFFGPMKGKVNQSIEIKDMQPSIFNSMLQFIYSDSVPDLEEARGNKDASVALAQHLLVAADRYGLERLKQLCELKMYEFIDANNLATTLTLAEQHNCSELKAACIEFIKRPEVLAAAVQTEGFEHMIKSCPTILEELRSKNDQ
ncbi:hypothetical protein LUZ63_016446 [Rhynchospora breviuscula]|uniref:Uncharacterized protein n=1 Tax=Rhynchospora breviuscula TaxID=2022672 RepID=A0A9P9ZBL5_9POAL|nr:hypothetical protein LUZ63_016446 [Rhynchospora breviuscula]